MMKLLPKKLFRWREPREYLLWRDGETAKLRLWWHRWLVAGSSMLSVLGVWGLALLNPAKDPPGWEAVLPLAIFFGLFMAYGVPWMVGLCPSEVQVLEKMLMVSRGNTHQTMPWTSLVGYTMGEWQGLREVVTVVVLQLKNGDALEMGLGPEVEKREFEEFLRGKVRANVGSLDNGG